MLPVSAGVGQDVAFSTMVARQVKVREFLELFMERLAAAPRRNAKGTD